MPGFDKKKFAELLKKAQGNRSLNEFARQAEVSNSYLSNLMRCKKDNAPEGKTISKIADAAYNEVSFTDLLEAAGLLTPEQEQKMLKLARLKELSNEFSQNEKSLFKSYQDLDSAKREMKEATAEYKALVDIEKIGGEPVTQFIRVPLLGNIAAGQPLFASEHIKDWEYIPKNGYTEGEVFSLLVKGDSMIGSRIYEGDKVIVRVQPEVEDGEIAVVNVDGENATLKRVKRLDGKFILLSDNPRYEPIVIDSENARICGKVVQVIFNPNSKK